MSGLNVDVRVGETIYFNGSGRVKVTVKSKSGQLARLSIDAEDGIDIHPPTRESAIDVVKNGINQGSKQA